MILDSILLLLIVVVLQVIKNKYPNFLFFPKGAVLFLPPQDFDNKQKKKDNSQTEVAVLKVQYQHVKEYPFANQLSRILLTTASLILFVVIRIPMSLMFDYESMISFYVLAVILVYTLKLGFDTFILTNYNRTVCLLIAFGLNVLFFLLFAFLSRFEGVYDQTLTDVIEEYTKHLEIIFNRQFTFVTPNLFMLIVFIINFFVIVAIIPSIVKFGNWYAKTLKETQYQEENGEQIPIAKRKDREDVDERQQAANLKKESKKLISSLNTYLVLMLVVMALSHRYFLTFLDEVVVDIIRGILIGICSSIICWKMSAAIEFNGSFAYRFVLEYFGEADSEKRKEIKKKIVPYIYYIWYHYFQFVIRIILPLILFLLLLTWKYLFFSNELITGPIQTRPLNLDFECSIHTDEMSILENLYSCSVNETLPSSIQKEYFLSGMIQTIPKTLSTTQIQNNMQQYGILTKNMMLQLFEQIFWYSGVSIYLLTVVYIGFLRKTVYDL